MELILKRLYKKSDYTIGKLYVNGTYLCDTLEVRDRDLYDTDELALIQDTKIYGQTAIPYGTYKVSYTYSNRFKKLLPLIHNVKGFDGIRIHSGNTAADTEGCILVGENTAVGKVLNSRKTYAELDALLQQAANSKQTITITIK